MSADVFDWLDIRTKKHTGLENRADIMRAGGQEGKDRVWWTDGEYIWFRREKSNPATLERHNKFIEAGDYDYVETTGDVEIWQIRPQSQFHDPKQKQIDIGKMSFYDLRRQAALAACRGDFEGFRDIMSFLKERVQAVYMAPDGSTALADKIYADQYMGTMESIKQRVGPSPQKINQELMVLNNRKGLDRAKLINIGGN